MANYKYYKREFHKSTSKNSLKIGTTTLSKPFDIAEAFSNYFSNIAPHLNNQLPNSNINPNSYLEGDFPQSMVVPNLTTQDLRNVIKKTS